MEAVEAAEEVAPTPQGNANPLDAYEAATRTGGNSATAKRIVADSKPKVGLYKLLNPVDPGPVALESALVSQPLKPEM